MIPALKPLDAVVAASLDSMRAAVQKVDELGEQDASLVLVCLADSPLSQLASPAPAPGAGVVCLLSLEDALKQLEFDEGLVAALVEPLQCGHRPSGLVASSMAYGVFCPRCRLELADRGAS